MSGHLSYLLSPAMEPNERVESVGWAFHPDHISNLEVVCVKGDGVVCEGDEMVCEGRWGGVCREMGWCVKEDEMVSEGRWDGVVLT